MALLPRKLLFQGSRGGPTFSRGGGRSYIFSRGSPNGNFYRNPITCDFPGGGGVRTPYPPSGSAHVSYGFVTFRCASWSTSEHKGEAGTVEHV